MSTFSYIIGGVGIFLLGMFLMTDGLKALAGEKLRNLLKRFVSGRISSILSGFFVTSIVQSSSATTLMTIGFVSAGLISFRQSIGLILGANLGTTTTSWIVSLLGVKFKIMSIALPFIGIGAFLRFSKYQKYQLLGNILSGFGLIFVGIDVLQDGMGSLSSIFNLRSFGQGIFASIILLFIGILMAVIVQSSSVAIAMTITALFAGTISFEQAAVLAIGQNIGTTATALLGSIGGSISAKRTALAHAFFNIIVGLLVFFTLPLFIKFIYQIGFLVGINDAPTLLAIFHTTFNLIGIIIIFPLLDLFIKMIEKIAPEKECEFTYRLDSNVLLYPSLAIEAVHKTLISILIALNKELISELINKQSRNHNKIEEIEIAMNKVKEYFNQINGISSSAENQIYLSLVHAADHLRMLFNKIKDYDVEKLGASDSIIKIKEELNQAIKVTEEILLNDKKDVNVDNIENISKKIKEVRIEQRKNILQNIAAKKITSEKGLKEIEALFWIDGSCYHLWRTTVHLNKSI